MIGLIAFWLFLQYLIGGIIGPGGGGGVTEKEVEEIISKTNAGGDLTGKYPNPTIGGEKVVTADIKNLAVTEAKLAEEAAGENKLSKFLLAPAPSGGDDSKIIQELEEALPAGGGEIKLRASTYKFDTGVKFVKPITLRGRGTGGNYKGWYNLIGGVTTITCNKKNVVAIQSASGACIFRDFVLRNNSAEQPEAGTSAGIEIVRVAGKKAEEEAGTAPLAGANNRYINLDIEGFNIALDIKVGVGWEVRGCHLSAYVKWGIRIKNEWGADSCDCSIIGVWFTSAKQRSLAAFYKAEAHLRWESGGGVKIVNCKVNNSPEKPTETVAGRAFDFVFATETPENTTDIQITNCSLEACENMIRIKTEGVRTIGNITINNNQLSALNGGIAGIMILIEGNEAEKIIMASVTGNVIKAEKCWVFWVKNTKNVKYGADNEHEAEAGKFLNTEGTNPGFRWRGMATVVGVRENLTKVTETEYTSIPSTTENVLFTINIIGKTNELIEGEVKVGANQAAVFKSSLIAASEEISTVTVPVPAGKEVKVKASAGKFSKVDGSFTPIV